MFRYIENKDRTFLFGAYRGEKSQLDWILGEKTQRYEKLYNIRFNKDLFSQRNGGTLSKVLPDFVLIYNTQNPQEGYHLFPCVNSSVKEQSEMEKLKYPNPNGSYVVFSSSITQIKRAAYGRLNDVPHPHRPLLTSHHSRYNEAAFRRCLPYDTAQMARAQRSAFESSTVWDDPAKREWHSPHPWTPDIHTRAQAPVGRSARSNKSSPASAAVPGCSRYSHMNYTRHHLR